MKILRHCKKLGILLFMDECFNEFLEDPQEYTTKEYLKAFDNLIILKAFTKIYAMAGLRLGHCISANTGLLKKIREAGQPWSVSTPAQIAGIRAMEEKAYLIKTKKLIREEREYLVPKLTELGISVIASNANYIFIKDNGAGVKPLHEMLFEKGILIRNCDNYRGLGPGYYRICIRKHEENIKLLKTLKTIKEG
jgi:threonine-phosphate decarboxylase